MLTTETTFAIFQITLYKVDKNILSFVQTPHLNLCTNVTVSNENTF